MPILNTYICNRDLFDNNGTLSKPKVIQTFHVYLSVQDDVTIRQELDNMVHTIKNLQDENKQLSDKLQKCLNDNK